MLRKRYNPRTAEPDLQARWQEAGTYHFEPRDHAPVHSIDTPPPTVSGKLHLGHVYSYSQTDFFARYRRMQGFNVFYPMGFDDNGLPTERLVEQEEGVRASEIGRGAFIERCLAVSEEAEREYRALWERLGLSVDWRYTYRTIEPRVQRISQWSFIDLQQKGLAYRRHAPALWCPECQTAIAQAELNDLNRSSPFYTLNFLLADGQHLPVATTRPELLPACVAVLVHPDDERYQDQSGQQVTAPLFGQSVPLLPDPSADPEKGTGVVMCCTFGDTADVEWWYRYDLPLVEAIGPNGRMTDVAGQLAGMTTVAAREAIVKDLSERGALQRQTVSEQVVRVHERCDTPIEYIVTQQWFIRVLDFKAELLAAGAAINWHPAHMETRYRQWVENLNWDWCISRQRYFGVPFPVWYCRSCGAIRLAAADQLPVDPLTSVPDSPCDCGSRSFEPEAAVMDTWATSSLTPQIVGGWSADNSLYEQTFPFSLRPQAHEIIRTWAFYTIVKSWHHFRQTPFTTVAISGWGLAPQGSAKLSKSRGGGPITPAAWLEKYSADAVRYWAASTSLGKDAVISEKRVQSGARLVTKLWNIARFSQPFVSDVKLPAPARTKIASLLPADSWMLARTQQLIEQVTSAFEHYDYVNARQELEHFLYRDLADNYLEMIKQRLYEDRGHETTRQVLALALLATVKMLAPMLPHVTETIYAGLFATGEVAHSIHRSRWPKVVPAWQDLEAITFGNQLVAIASAVRRYKSELHLPLGESLHCLQLATSNDEMAARLRLARADLSSVTRAQQIEIVASVAPVLENVAVIGEVTVALGR